MDIVNHLLSNRKINMLICFVLLAIILSKAAQDPSPWSEPFYQAARFDGQLAISANYAQIALGLPVDCLMWPGLPNLAMGSLIAKSTGINRLMFKNENSKSEVKTILYTVLDKVSRLGNILGLIGVLLLTLSTYIFLEKLLASKIIAFCASAYLASSQIVATQIGWLRPEVWSLGFFSMAIIMILPDITYWLDQSYRKHRDTVSRDLRVGAAGFLASSAVLEKVNIVPAVVLFGVVFVIVILANLLRVFPKDHLNRESSMAMLFYTIYPLLLLPWWAFAYPNESYWSGVAEFDSSTARALGESRWYIFTTLLLVISVSPFLLFLGLKLTVRVFQSAKRYEYALACVFRTAGQLIAGGLCSLIFWTGIISANIETFRHHVTHTLVMVAATVFGVNIFAQAHTDLRGITRYILDSGQMLARPNLEDLLSVFGLHASNAASLNVTTMALILSIVVVVLLLLGHYRSARLLKVSAVGFIFAFLMVISDYLASKRGVYNVDFRYYAYAGWFGIVAISCFTRTLFMAKTGAISKKILNVIGLILFVCLMSAIVLTRVATASENAIFGRQFYIAPQTAPNLFKSLGVSPERSDWHFLLAWKSCGLTPALQALQDNDPSFASRFKWEADKDSVNTARCSTNGGPGSLQMRIPVIFNSNNTRTDDSIALKVLLQSSNQDRMPAVGIETEEKISGKVLLSKWSIISSAWGPSDKPEEYACGVRFNPKTQNAFVKIYWAPDELGECILIKDLSIGTPIQ